ncbi:hypothetical protein [Verrucomicrobium sp. GAS474]|uniref:hypothetical protein n=1 Tax=Verrucomicrobium sp. GAS474 TaxID=1882831 RepID=UPI0012FFC8E7|nr:hypothetical protein [Verrucomicrobium sp. GAS474]
MIRILDPETRARLGLLNMRVERTVRGCLKKGRRPYVEFEGVRYQNEVLSKSPSLVTKQISIFIDIDDLRMVKAFFPDGQELGTLVARGGWAIRAHDLATRRAINQLRYRKLIQFVDTEDPIEIYLKYLNETAGESKKARTKLAHIQKKARESQTAEEEPNTDSAPVSAPQQFEPFDKGLFQSLGIKALNF